MEVLIQVGECELFFLDFIYFASGPFSILLYHCPGECVTTLPKISAMWQLILDFKETLVTPTTKRW
jgi:hypothetical protein